MNSVEWNTHTHTQTHTHSVLYIEIRQIALSKVVNFPNYTTKANHKIQSVKIMIEHLQSGALRYSHRNILTRQKS